MFRNLLISLMFTLSFALKAQESVPQYIQQFYEENSIYGGIVVLSNQKIAIGAICTKSNDDGRCSQFNILTLKYEFPLDRMAGENQLLEKSITPAFIKEARTNFENDGRPKVVKAIDFMFNRVSSVEVMNTKESFLLPLKLYLENFSSICGKWKEKGTSLRVQIACNNSLKSQNPSTSLFNVTISANFKIEQEMQKITIDTDNVELSFEDEEVILNLLDYGTRLTFSLSTNQWNAELSPFTTYDQESQIDLIWDKKSMKLIKE